ncbi:hypothetical protein KVF89_22590 [Nocardioides carbamazepini]|uniref:hypothetical protein n=1 Tax=Nocardioides carbamazepini TaxID=2854259 RepID=UPI00214A6115|nr:hypothetical protein [Nocardioides carbamazepini]MCR1785346.1 hypothetical protein [Nocardioides carbamazepini]
MKAISIRQPWAGAIALGWKPIENRPRMLSHRGQVLIHAGKRLADDYDGAVATIRAAGYDVPDLRAPGLSAAWGMGGIVGVADLHAAHRGCDGSCAPGWAQRGQIHHMVRDARPLGRLVPAPGRLFMWTPDDDVLDAVREVWPR